MEKVLVTDEVWKELENSFHTCSIWGCRAKLLIEDDEIIIDFSLSRTKNGKIDNAFYIYVNGSISFKDEDRRTHRYWWHKKKPLWSYREQKKAEEEYIKAFGKRAFNKDKKAGDLDYLYKTIESKTPHFLSFRTLKSQYKKRFKDVDIYWLKDDE